MRGKSVSESTLQHTEHQPVTDLPLRFAFGGAMGDVLRESFECDARQARLSAKFKVYYRLRPFIPILIRQFLQQGRNRGFDLPDDWYLPIKFVDRFLDAACLEPRSLAIHPWPDGHQMSMVLTHDVETKAGVAMVDRLAAMEEEYGLRSAWYFIPHKYDFDPDLLKDLKNRGHEVGIHGYNHDGRLFESPSLFQRRVDPINQALTDYGCTGFRAPMVHRNLNWMQALDIDHDGSCFDIDPFQAMPGGVGGVWPFFAGKFVELPYTLRAGSHPVRFTE